MWYLRVGEWALLCCFMGQEGQRERERAQSSGLSLRLSHLQMQLASYLSQSTMSCPTISLFPSNQLIPRPFPSFPTKFTIIIYEYIISVFTIAPNHILNLSIGRVNTSPVYILNMHELNLNPSSKCNTNILYIRLDANKLKKNLFFLFF